MPTHIYIGGGVSELTFVASAAAVSQFVPKPTGIQEGDLLAVFEWMSPVTTPVVPSGFASIEDTGVFSINVHSMLKVVDASDVANSIEGTNATVDRKLSFLFRPNDAIETVSVADKSEQAVSSGAVSDQAVLAASRSTPVLVFGAAGQVAASPPVAVSSSPPFDLVEVVAGQLAAGFKLYNSAPADHANSAVHFGGVQYVFQSFSISVS